MADERQNQAPAPDLKEELQATRQLMAQQEESARLLVRRDLELSRANEKLRQLDQMKTDFVTVAAHQLRTPLSGIKWTLSMLLKGDLGPLNDEQRTFTMKAYESNNRMITLLNDMLLSDRVESGKLQLSDEPSRAVELIENLLIELKPIADKKALTLSFIHQESSYPDAKIAPGNLRAVMQNLIENAIKYSNNGSAVIIEASLPHSGTIALSVKDSGIGIPQEERQKVFTRFFRAQNAVKKEPDGTGLGLFIVKSIVEKHHGTIRFESSEAETTFFVELPTDNHNET